MQFHLAGWTLPHKAAADRKPALLQLDRAPQHQWLEVVEVPQGRGAARSLAHLGVLVKERLRVQSAAPWGGPVLVEVGATTVAIGRGLASRIKVRVLRREPSREEPRLS
jgi:ferrous iron transport protein A